MTGIKLTVIGMAVCLAGCGTSAPKSAAGAGTAEVLAGYEKLRALLADDQAQVGDAAGALAEAARKAAAESNGSLKESLGKIATAADAVREPATADLAEVRRRFGEVSRAVILLAVADPSLVGGRHVFECPMVEKGYGKWVQNGEEASNPYFGKDMLTCGSAGEWKE